MGKAAWKFILQLPRQRKSHLGLFLILTLSAFALVTQVIPVPFLQRRIPPHVSLAISRCQQLELKVGPLPGFYERTRSDRYANGTKPVLLKRARIWTGGNNGTEVVRGDILLDRGLFQAVGHVPQSTLSAFGDDLVIVDAKNAWVTPGLVDMHSHIGNSAAPELAGASQDYNSDLGNIQVRSGIVYSI
jgi:hypothetical protein